MGDDFSLEDLMIILRRRFKFFLIPVIILVPILSLIVMVLPPQYKSEGVMLIESPQISEELVRSSSSTRALERIEVIRQRIISRPVLLEIADGNGLFANKGSNYSSTKKVKKMRDRLKIATVQSDIITNRPGGNAIAFRLSYKDRSAIKATQAANDFINRFEAEHRKQTAKNASDTTEFFEEKTREFTAELQAKQQEIANFKQENEGALPEQLALHQRQLERFGTQMAQLESQESSIQEEKRFVESQLTSNASGGGSENSPENLLLAKRSALGDLRSRYTDSHPEVVAVLNEIRALEAQLAPGRKLQGIKKRLDKAEDDLLAAIQDGKEAEIIADLQRSADALSDQFEREAAIAGGLSSDTQSILLTSRISSLSNRARSVEAQRIILQERIDDLEARINRTPAVESFLDTLITDKEFIESQLEGNKIAQAQAQSSEDLQTQNRAERISVVEAAVIPEKPSSPNRPGFILIAIMFSLLSGFACALGYEFMNATVRGRNHLGAILGEPPLVVIPYIPGSDDAGGNLAFLKMNPKLRFGKSKPADNTDEDIEGEAA